MSAGTPTPISLSYLIAHCTCNVVRSYNSNDSRYYSVSLGLRITHVIIYQFLCMNVVKMCLTRKHLLICLME